MWLRFINNRINKQITGMRLVVLLLGVLIISCKFNNNKKYAVKFTHRENRTVFIQPFTSIDTSYIIYLRNHIRCVNRGEWLDEYSPIFSMRKLNSIFFIVIKLTGNYKYP